LTDYVSKMRERLTEAYHIASPAKRSPEYIKRRTMALGSEEQ